MHQSLRFIFGIELYMFRTVPLYIIKSFSLSTQQWYTSCRFADSLRAGSGRTMRIYHDARSRERQILPAGINNLGN